MKHTSIKAKRQKHFDNDYFFNVNLTFNEIGTF